MAKENHITGGCLCGGVRYRLQGELRGVINCFCSQCRKTSGHYVAATQVRNQDLVYLQDETLKWYASSENAERGFCSRCGGSLFWRLTDSDTTSIMAGTLGLPTGLKTVENIFTEDKSDYHPLPPVS